MISILQGRRFRIAYQKQFQTLIDAFPGELFIVDQDGKIVHANDGARKSFQEVFGKPFAEIIPADFITLARTTLQDAIDSGSPQKFEFNKSTIPYEARITPLSRDEFLITLNTPYIQNCTDQRNNNTEENKADADQKQTNLLAHISHEIRTPMTGIMGMTELVLSGDLTPEQRENLNIVKASSETLMVIINEILDLSKIESGKLLLEPTKFRLRDLIEDSLKSINGLASKKNLNLSFHLSSKVPDALIGDAGRLRQIITNLLENSVRSTDKGAVTLRVEPNENISDRCISLLFSVTDTGKGISAERKNCLFEDFSEGKNPDSRSYGVTGLGLILSKKLVRLMGGNIWAESPSPFVRKEWATPGSTIYFAIPLEKQEKETSVLKPQRGLVSLQGLRVLILSDNEIKGHRLQKLIFQWEMSPRMFTSKNKALDSFLEAKQRNIRYQLIIINSETCSLNELELARQISETDPQNKPYIILITSDPEDRYYDQHKNFGIHHYLKDPLKASKLLDTILSMVSGKAGMGIESSNQVFPDVLDSFAVYPLKILLAEDNIINQKLALRMLQRLGHHVNIANNGKEAIRQWEQNSYDIILMDIQMPEMDGFEATSVIRKREKYSGGHIPVIALTAHAMTGDRERCLASGMDGYAAKPLKFESLIPEIERLTSPLDIEA